MALVVVLPTPPATNSSSAAARIRRTRSWLRAWRGWRRKGEGSLAGAGASAMGAAADRENLSDPRIPLTKARDAHNFLDVRTAHVLSRSFR